MMIYENNNRIVPMIKQKRVPVLLATLIGFMTVNLAQAHHSFSVYYDPEKMVTVSGVVEDFRFSNPHGIIHLKALNEDGDEVIWTIETTAPVFMARRGWSKNTIKAGEPVSIKGWHSRDGSNLMRMQAAFRPDGSQIEGSLDANDK
jgi:hypothetical protein